MNKSKNLEVLQYDFSSYIRGSAMIGGTINGAAIKSEGAGTTTIEGGKFLSIGSTYETSIENGQIDTKYMNASYINLSQSGSATTIAPNGLTLRGASIAVTNGGYISCPTINGGTPITSDNINSSHSHYDLTDSGYSVRWNGVKFFPWSSGADLGDSSHRWGTIYAQSGTINTSDRDLKHDIENLPGIYKELIRRLKPVRFKYNDGTSNRYHTGFISQDVEGLLNELGMSSQDFAGFIKAPTYSIISDDGTYDISSDVTGYVYMLRYEEFISPAISVIQEQEQRIKNLEERLAKLESIALHLK
jgi:hypothetical protein